MGVKTVVSLRTFSSDRDALKGTGLRYVRIPCQAWRPDEADVLRFLKVVADPANQPVFVHCQQGADRTGCAVAVYRVVEQGWKMEDAVAEMERFGFHPVWGQITEYLGRFDAAKVSEKLKGVEEPKGEVVE